MKSKEIASEDEQCTTSLQVLFDEADSSKNKLISNACEEVLAILGKCSKGKWEVYADDWLDALKNSSLPLISFTYFYGDIIQVIATASKGSKEASEVRKIIDCIKESLNSESKCFKIEKIDEIDPNHAYCGLGPEECVYLGLNVKVKFLK